MKLKVKIELTDRSDCVTYTIQEDKLSLPRSWNANKVLVIECTDGSVLSFNSDKINMMEQIEVKNTSGVEINV